MPELWSATLNPHGSNYEMWHSIFGGGRVPLTSSLPVNVTIGNEKDVEAYMLELRAMTLRQRALLLGALAQKFQTPIFEVEAEITRVGFPIRATDVIVTISLRAFV